MSDQTSSRTPATQDANAPTPASDNSLAWSDARLLGFTPMDDVHEEFYTLALQLVTCSDASAADVIERFEQHAISHFEQEDEWMRSTNFPRATVTSTSMRPCLSQLVKSSKPWHRERPAPTWFEI